MGEDGPADVKVLAVAPRDVDEVSVIEELLGGSEKEACGDGGWVGIRDNGCCLIRRNPEAPTPCS